MLEMEHCNRFKALPYLVLEIIIDRCVVTSFTSYSYTHYACNVCFYQTMLVIHLSLYGLFYFATQLHLINILSLCNSPTHICSLCNSSNTSM